MSKTIKQATALAYQILTDYIDPLVDNIHFYNNTTTGYLQLTTVLPKDKPNQLTVRETLNLITRAITKSYENYDAIIIISSPAYRTLTIEDPSTYHYEHQGKVEEIRGEIFIGIERPIND